MSADPRASGGRLERKRRRAEADIRAAHAMARAIPSGGDRTWWREAQGGAWSPAELSLHLALVAEKVLEGLQTVAAAGIRVGTARPRPVRKTALHLLLITWMFPRGVRPIPGTEPAGVVMTPEQLEERHLTWATDFVTLFREQAAEFLPHILYEHPHFGMLSALQWARYLRVHCRHHELRLGHRTSG